MRPRLTLCALAIAGALLHAAPQSPSFMPVGEVRAGMVGVGQTVYAAGQLEEFQATVLGVLENVVGPGRDVILARLEGGPLANTGVIQGMSGSPVYIDGRLVGALAYALGTFPKEPIAGITPIEEMLEDVGSPVAPGGADLAIDWPAPAEAVYAALERLAARATAPLGPLGHGFRVDGPAALADLAPALRPIGAAFVLRGFEGRVDRDLRQAFAADAAGSQQATDPITPAGATAQLRPGDPVGMTMVRGDLEMGATGTVTYVDGDRVYAFGHPFLNLGPTSMAMTRANVITVLPSLSSSMKIATLGEVIGTFTQDRASAVGGTLGQGPDELEVRLTLSSDHAPARTLRFFVVHDASLTPLMSYVAVLNSLFAYERQTGPMSVEARGTIEMDTGDSVTIDNVFSGPLAAVDAAGTISAPIGVVVGNEFREVMPTRMDVDLRVTEAQERATIERVWLDTTRPELGGSYRVHVQLRDYRGGSREISVPVTLPAHAAGPLTLLVSDAATLQAREAGELRPGRATSWPDVIDRLNDVRHNSTVYVRLISSSPGTVVDGRTLPALPASVQSVLQADTSAPRAPTSATVVGAWEARLDRAVGGSRELTLHVQPRQ